MSDIKVVREALLEYGKYVNVEAVKACEQARHRIFVIREKRKYHWSRFVHFFDTSIGLYIDDFTSKLKRVIIKS